MVLTGAFTGQEHTLGHLAQGKARGQIRVTILLARIQQHAAAPILIRLAARRAAQGAAIPVQRRDLVQQSPRSKHGTTSRHLLLHSI